jgi:hypothetical protein
MKISPPSTAFLGFSLLRSNQLPALPSSPAPSPPSSPAVPAQLHTSTPARLRRDLPPSPPPLHGPGSVIALPWRSRPRLGYLLEEAARRRHRSGGGRSRSPSPATSTTPAASTTPRHLRSGRSGDVSLTARKAADPDQRRPTSTIPAAARDALLHPRAAASCSGPRSASLDRIPTAPERSGGAGWRWGVPPRREPTAELEVGGGARPRSVGGRGGGGAPRRGATAATSSILSASSWEPTAARCARDLGALLETYTVCSSSYGMRMLETVLPNAPKLPPALGPLVSTTSGCLAS